ncbi:hypothetical protein ABT369_44865 [Dactylosporangium sp. NPDC000244]|uniref:hypothetical protein n=1 Tax=Dactylosporangium sp. NPDC000244 TaxID=3154365 RepID=UPI00332B78A2
MADVEGCRPHDVVALGVAPGGTTRSMQLAVTVTAAGASGTTTLATTGRDRSGPLATALLAIALGVPLRLGRPGRPRT